MPNYRHLNPELVERVCADVDQQLDEQYRTEQIDAWMRTHPQELAAVRQEFARIDAAHQRQSAPSTEPAPRFAPGTPQNPIPATARFSPRDLAYDRPSVSRIVDPIEAITRANV